MKILLFLSTLLLSLPGQSEDPPAAPPGALVGPWSGFASAGRPVDFAALLEQPQCLSARPDYLQCFIRDHRGALWIREWRKLRWSSWRSLEGQLTTPPECTLAGDGQFHCIGVSRDGQLSRLTSSAAGRGGWETLAFSASDQPVCLTAGSVDRITCFARSAQDQTLWQVTPGNKPQRIGGPVAGRPTCVSGDGGDGGDVVCLGVDEDGAVLWNARREGRWSDWQVLGGRSAGRPACIRTGPRQLDCIVRGGNNQLFYRGRTGAKWDERWQSLGGDLADDPECISRGPGLIDCFLQGADGGLAHIGAVGGKWLPWVSLGGRMRNHPSCTSWGVDRVDCFVRGTDGDLWQRSWPATVFHRLIATRGPDNPADRYRLIPISRASNTILLSDGEGDVSCGVSVSHRGRINPVADLNSIHTPAAMAKATGGRAQLHLANAITWCGKTRPGILACGSPGQKGHALVYPSPQDAALLVHQLGHLVGLPDTNVADMLMNPALSPSSNRLSAAECRQIRGDSIANASASVGEVPLAVEDFVRRTHVHGISIDQARQYAGDQLDASEQTLLQVLEDPASQAHWSNAAVLLGLIGSAEAFVPLQQMLERPTAQALTPADFRARTSALMALGYLSSRGDYPEALDLLARASQPDFWRGPAEHGSIHFRPEQAQQELSVHARLGLALSGQPEAAAALGRLPDSPLKAHALEVHAQVARLGLEGYYGAAGPGDGP